MTNRKEELGKEILAGLYDTHMILTWHRDKPDGWVMASGLWTPFYINLRLISSASPDLYRKVADGFSLLLEEADFKPDGRTRVVGIAMAGVPLANAITLQYGIPSLYTRKLPETIRTREAIAEYTESHGHHALVEGDMRSWDKLGIIDDLVTRFDSKVLAHTQLELEIERRGLTGIRAEDFFVLLDREQGGSQRAKELGYRMHSLIPFASKGLGWLRGTLSDIEYETISDYLNNPQKYQPPGIRKELKERAKPR